MWCWFCVVYFWLVRIYDSVASVKNTITATISVKNIGEAREPIWQFRIIIDNYFALWLRLCIERRIPCQTVRWGYQTVKKAAIKSTCIVADITTRRNKWKPAICILANVFYRDGVFWRPRTHSRAGQNSFSWSRLSPLNIVIRWFLNRVE